MSMMASSNSECPKKLAGSNIQGPAIVAPVFPAVKMRNRRGKGRTLDAVPRKKQVSLAPSRPLFKQFMHNPIKTTSATVPTQHRICACVFSGQISVLRRIEVEEGDSSSFRLAFFDEKMSQLEVS